MDHRIIGAALLFVALMIYLFILRFLKAAKHDLLVAHNRHSTKEELNKIRLRMRMKLIFGYLLVFAFFVAGVRMVKAPSIDAFITGW